MKGKKTVQYKKIWAGALLAALAVPATAGVKWYEVDPMGEVPYLPDRAPANGREGKPLGIVAAKGEYEPCSFVLVSDEDVGKVKLEVSDLKSGTGDVLSKEKLDLKTVKVWYQAGNAWTSYFADNGLRLTPELLLNDEDLVRVDTKKVANSARLTEKDGRVHYRWLTPPSQVDGRGLDDTGYTGVYVEGSFASMKPNFCDAKTHQGATLKKGEYKQFWLTAEVGKDVKAGLYKGEVKVKGEGEQWSIPLVLRVLDFELPGPKCYFDVKKDFQTSFCEYVGIEIISSANGNDRELAKKQLSAILRDYARHNYTTPCFRDVVELKRLGEEAGLVYDEKVVATGMTPAEPAQMRYDARRKREQMMKAFGRADVLAGFCDEYGWAIMRGVRDMVRTYHDEGLRFVVNSWMGYEGGAYFSDLWWPAKTPDGFTSKLTFKFNQLGGDGTFGWYACQHVGNENPAFCRRQYGFGPYRAGLSCNYNYAHHLGGWNDLRGGLYRSMNFIYGTGDGCVDTIQWEGFREGLDDIRYATKLKQLAEPFVKGTTEQRYAAKKALQLLADADGDNMDLSTLRLEMIRHIERLSGFAVKRLSGALVAKEGGAK